MSSSSPSFLKQFFIFGVPFFIVVFVVMAVSSGVDASTYISAVIGSIVFGVFMTLFNNRAGVLRHRHKDRDAS